MPMPIASAKAMSRTVEVPITRKGVIDTNVTLCLPSYSRVLWLHLGQFRLRPFEGQHEKGIWEFAAHLANATDPEHDNAYAMKMELVGVELTLIHYGITAFSGWIRSDNSEDFRVPSAGYDPRKHKDTVRCKDKQCSGEKHYIVPEGFYVPPPNPELFELVRGCRIEVESGARDR